MQLIHFPYTKSNNRLLVLDYIRRNENCSRAEIAKAFGFSRSTVSLLVEKLLQNNMVKEMGLGASTAEGGRKGTNLAFNYQSYSVIGVDVTNSSVLCVLTDLAGQVLKKVSLPPVLDVSLCAQKIVNFYQECNHNESPILGIGVSVPSIVDHTKSIVIDAPSLGWKSVNFKAELKKYIPIPIFINNDVDSAALGEHWIGKGASTDHFFYLSIGTGIGSAIISDGRLVPGFQYSAGEIGYFVDKEDLDHDNTYKFGKFGSFEHKVIHLLQEYKEKRSLEKDLVIDVSIALANVISLLNPERVIIGGQKSNQLMEIMDSIRTYIKRFSPLQTTIEKASLNHKASSIGVISYVIEKSFYHILVEKGGIPIGK
ncbi:ROK family protein [Terrilactibacillus sp. BCM23-1]|uniref:ROK family protein n=1 Tax=Terrilactibacillus tamarindi TaxID=2599694 RepID=A0A6N8CQA1_9BACI|nr:ROK family transcriptional regulator [Terrilactibacillus tamarindi]MTT31848.1 ROK family protein [Terrilactibacillus tamarindi]